tara:strand:+ start:2258 stop:2866 length:609 start_codon:yes stop_codon:yes gene_type:complete
MKQLIIKLLCLLCLCVASLNATTNLTKKNPLVLIETTKGNIIVKLFPQEAPITCENFLSYVNEGFYTNTLIHRVIDGFIIQGGGFTPDYIPKKTKKHIKNESRKGLSNTKGSLAMALTTSKHSATTQFFINLADNLDLDYTTKKGKGYTVFGEVIDGEETLDNIRRTRTRKINIFSERHNQNVALHDTPIDKIIIKSIKVLR